MYKTALMFAGQGAQTVGMGQELATASPAAQALFDRANRTLGRDLASICFSGPEAELTKTENAQPGIYLVSWVAWTLLKERLPRLSFQAAAGLSLGEFTALAVAGGWSFETGLKLVQARGRFMQEACEVTQGGMAAIIGLDEVATRDVCEEAKVTLANLNCPGQLVISGAADRIPAAIEAARARGAKRAIALAVAGAYHSPLMESAQPKLATELAAKPLQQLEVPVLANVTAKPHGAVDTIAPLLVRQVTSPVRWEESIRFLLASGFNRFIELGPGNALTGFLRRIDKTALVVNVADLKSLAAAVTVLSAP